MNKETTIKNQTFTCERPLFHSNHLYLENCLFDEGESALKECADIEAVRCAFRWKYPIWYGRNYSFSDCYFNKSARAGMWYIDDLTVSDSTICAPKAFRRCKNVRLSRVILSNGEESLWNCTDCTLDHVSVHGNYFGKDSTEVTATHLEIIGEYCFDGSRNVIIDNSRIVGRDAFWNSRNVTVKNSFISGKYLGWNSSNMVFENCIIESLQGMCYIEKLKLVNCRLINTTLAFEYSSINAEIIGSVDSIINPKSGIIRADEIKELFIEDDKVDPSATVYSVVRE